MYSTATARHPSIAERGMRALDARMAAEVQLAGELQRTEPAITRTEALRAAKKLTDKVDFRDGRVHSLSLGQREASR
jgi:hypothetical protein